MKAFTIRELTKRGFIKREDLNFSDDGNRFIGFEYKGMPITYLKSDGEFYLSVRVDYLDNSFTYNEWMKTEECRLTDEFNGVSSIDADKLVENIEKIINKVNELNFIAENEEIDMTAVKVKVEEEIKMAQEVVDDFKKNFEWWNTYSNSQLIRMADYLKQTVKNIERAKRIDFDNITRVQKKQCVEILENHHYVIFKRSDFYLTKMKEAIGN